MTRILIAGLLLLAVAACTPWARVDSAGRQETKGDYALQLPVGWVKRTTGSDDFFVTRDGPALNAITVNRRPHDQKLPGTKRETSAAMLPHEMGELIIAEWKSNGATAHLEVLSNTPATLGGKPGVRVYVRWKNERGLPVERLIYALVDQKGRFTLQYEAPGIVYFQRGLPDFEAMVKSVRFKS
jgi:hypothetical protein